MFLVLNISINKISKVPLLSIYQDWSKILKIGVLTLKDWSKISKVEKILKCLSINSMVRA